MNEQYHCFRLRGAMAVFTIAIVYGGLTTAIAAQSKPYESAWNDGQRIIMFGGLSGATGGVPTPAELRQSIEKWSHDLPFDGMLISADPGGVFWADTWMTSKPYKIEDFARNIADLKAVSAAAIAGHYRMRYNYLRLDVMPGDVSWFDDAGWNTIVHNAELSAIVIRDGGLAGIALDTEQYNDALARFAYRPARDGKGRTPTQLQDIAYQRGLAIGRAWKRIMPDMHVWLTFGPSQVVYELGAHGQLPLERSSMPLICAFTDGLLAADLHVTDAYEGSYRYKQPSEFELARWRIKEGGLRYTRDKALYKNLDVGFGLWPAPEKWDTDQYWHNGYTPDEMKLVVDDALQHSDGFIWVYFGNINALNSTAQFPTSYREAIVAGRKLAAQKKSDSRIQVRPEDVSNPGNRHFHDEPGRVLTAGIGQMRPKRTDANKAVSISDSAIGLENWNQRGKMAIVVAGPNETGTVRFTFPEAIPDGDYRLLARVSTPPGKNDSHCQWRMFTSSGKITPAFGQYKPDEWTPIQFGLKDKGTKLGYAQWMWLELAGPNQPFGQAFHGWVHLEDIGKDGLEIEVRDDDASMYHMTQWDQFVLLRRRPADQMKIIAFGGFPAAPGGVPDPTYLRAHETQISQLPFDGVVFNISNKVGYFPDSVFDLQGGISLADLQADIDRMRQFTQNNPGEDYLLVDITSMNFDWFDDSSWTRAVERFHLIGAAAKACGAAGIMFDTRQHAAEPFSYAQRPQRSEKTFEEYVTKVRLRGGQAMAAMRDADPAISVMLTVGPSTVLGENLKTASYGLLPAFVDGLLDKANGCRIIDADRQSFRYRRATQFQDAAWMIRYGAANLSAIPRTFMDRMRVGFGICPAESSPAATQALTNGKAASHIGYTPANLEYELNFALENSDGTVWLCGRGGDWSKMSREYIDAIRNAKKIHNDRFDPQTHKLEGADESPASGK